MNNKIIEKAKKDLLAEIKRVHGPFLKAYAEDMGEKVGDIEMYLDGMRLEGELASIAEYRGFLDVLNAMAYHAAPRVIVVEVSGGVVNDVHGLREGDMWELADWDTIDEAMEKRNPKMIKNIEKLIEKAKAQK